MSEFRPGRFQMLPLVIKNLLIINGLVFLAQVTLENMYGYRMENLFGLHYWGSELFKPHQFVTHLFMHGGFGHVFFNMFALWMFGSALENIWGPKRFLVFYIICGIGAAFCHMLVLTYENMQVVKEAQHFFAQPSFDTYSAFYQKYPSLSNYKINVGNAEVPMQSFVDSWSTLPPESYDMVFRAKQYIATFVQDYANVPTVGASGAVFGILFAFGYLFPNNYLFILPIPFPIKAKYFIGGYILLELYLGISNAGDDNVAHWAHLGGALFGYLLLKFWNKRNRRTLY